MSWDLEVSEVYVTSWQVARNEHRCQCCGGKVVIGAQYRRDHIVDDGTARSEACCFACACSLTQLLHLVGFAPAPSWAMEWLHENISDAGRSPKVKLARREERDLLAGMLRRNRGAA